MKENDKSTIDSYHNVLVNLIDELSKLDKKNIISFRNFLINQINNFYQTNNVANKINKSYANNARQKKSRDDDKKELIGKLPFILMESKHFKSNQALFDLAQRLNIDIRNWEKRSKEEIIGRIIVNVSKFKGNRITMLNSILNELLGKVEAGKIDDFFLEWDNVIKHMK